MSEFVSNFVMKKHLHKNVRISSGVYACEECLRQYDARKVLLAKTGYAAAVCRLFAALDGKSVRYRQFRTQPAGYGRVIDWEYPNCCLHIEDVAWFGETFLQRSSWLRFGWCGLLNPESEFEVIGD